MTGPAPAPGSAPKKKIAILGGGQAALTVALQLTDPANPHHADYDITIYQLGWRLGGKGATGRPVGQPWVADRIEEHGLHTWFGFYDNSFCQMRGVFTELAKTTGPLKTFDDAFEGVNEMVFVEDILGQPQIWTIHNPTNNEEPGTCDNELFLNPWAYVQMAIELLLGQLDATNLPFVGQVTPLLQQIENKLIALAAERHQSREGISLLTPGDIVKSTLSIVSDIRRSVDADIDYPGTAILELIDDTRKGVEDDAGDGSLFLWPAPCGGSLSYAAVTWMLSLFMKAFWTAVGTNIETPAKDTERHLWIEANLAYACITGAMCDGVVDNGFDVINDIDFRHWIAKHQYTDGGVLQRSPILEAIYTASFAYPRGDQTRGPNDAWPLAEDMEAGAALRGLVRTAFTYKGSFAYRFRFGTADTCFAPIYELLTTKRGVKVEFFQRVADLHLDAAGTAIASIDLAIQAQVTPAQQALGGYAPLVDVHGLPCWPSSPLWGQLADGAWLDGVDADLENPSAAVRARETPVTLTAGIDFDIVVLGIPVADHQNIASELTAASPAWLQSFQEVKTVRTQALQVWLTKTGVKLGLPAPNHATATWLYNADSPLNVLGDFSELLPIEWWPPVTGPTFLGYLCSTMPDGPGDPNAPFPDQVAADAIVRQNAITLLQSGLPTILPGTKVGPGFDWLLLYDARPTPGVGSARIDAQYHRANITPSERYVLSVTDSTQYRLAVHDAARFPNLYMAGDWTQCTLNAGCMEAATMSGMLCSNAIDGHPVRSAIIGVDF